VVTVGTRVGNNVGLPHSGVIVDGCWWGTRGVDHRAESGPSNRCPAAGGVGRDDIHVDHASGAKVSRPKLDLILRVLRDGDVMVVGLRGEPGRRRDSPMADPIGKAPRTYTAT